EDCELLLGYQVDRRHTWLHTVDGLVLLRVSHAPWPVRAVEGLARYLGQAARLRHHLARWDRYSFVASTGGGKAARDLVMNPAKRRELALQFRKDYREDREFVAAGILVAHAEDRELEGLDNAIAWGLVPAA